jgi:hypothetical protein
MRLSGVDPGIIRELSGIYKPFVKAFKELVSNAYDADAKTINVVLHDDFSRLDVRDDGVGMTPLDLERDFARIGGSSAWQRGGKSVGGRPRIGYKGIGFLAVARYCGALLVESHARHPFGGTRELRRGNRKRIPMLDIVGEAVPLSMLDGRVGISSVHTVDGASRKLLTPDEYALARDALQLLSKRATSASAFDIAYTVDFSGLRLRAKIDFDYLRSLERKADLRMLEDFCTVEVDEAASKEHGTTVTLHQLKDFVVRELSAPAAKGKARNVAFKSGEEQFRWRLARASPVGDRIPDDVACEPMLALRDAGRGFPKMMITWRSQQAEPLERQVYLAGNQAIPLAETVIPVDIKEGGLRAVGYLLARSEVIYPAELRGIAIRVRNVAIGEPSFLGWEHILSGPRKAAMSQISGEIRVLKGLDSADAINPGRESFYEEHPDYKVLKTYLTGSGESIGGLVGQAIRMILDRIRVRSHVNDALYEARTRRKTLTDISSAVNFHARATEDVVERLATFFQSEHRPDGLAAAKSVPIRPVHKIGGFDLLEAKGLGKDADIDYLNRQVSIDFGSDIWSTSLYLDGQFYDVVLKQGRAEHPICEFDNQKRRIYVNWGHPVKQQMDDASFLKSAILLRVAHHASADADTMMSLALNMLAYRGE